MILQNKYNREDFLAFQKDFLPDFKKDVRPFPCRGLQKTKDVFQIGYSEQLDLKIFEFGHTSSSDPRVSLTRDGFRVMKDSSTYLALAAYHSANSNDWRLSLMAANLEINEKGKVRQSFSDPRRYSFFLGPDAKVCTPNNFLIKKEPVHDVKDLLSRFDVEVVTKEFFANYRKLYQGVKEYLDNDQSFKSFASKKKIDIETFAKKLLGQIVFCYFLQRKGWLGAPKGKPIIDGDKDFMRSMFNSFIAEGKNYFNDCLEYLFYNSLNEPPQEAASFYRSYFQCQIPFLNGGLFEPLEDYDWKKEFLHIKNDIFSNKEKSGILDIFDLYNFTVYEDDPRDREVAVDPEMLGKVFENLLEENLRKGKGTYYTPREIVHYMCRESITNYLISESDLNEDKIRSLLNDHKVNYSRDEREKIDYLLASIKVCDPACGSGAFLVGMLNEIICLRRKVKSTMSEHQLKKEVIENCIYGVDIEPGAVEIAKLRLWLSLVVDYDMDDIEPLPNLDYKIMCGNSLLEELIVGDESIKLFNPSLLYKNKPKRKVSDNVMQMEFFHQDAEKFLKTLRRLHIEYFHEVDSDNKKDLRKKIWKIELDFIQASVNQRIEDIQSQKRNLNMRKPEDRKKNADLVKKENDYKAIPNEILRTKSRPYFLWHLNFFEVFQEKEGFDVVIANPPYSSKRSTEMKRYREFFECIEYKCDPYAFFIELALNLVRRTGFTAFIVPVTWMTNVYYQKLRRRMIDSNSLHRIILIEGLAFESANVDTSLLFLHKDSIHNDSFTWAKTDPTIASLELSTRTYQSIRDESRYDIVPNVDSAWNAIRKKVDSNSVKLGSFAKISLGMKLAGNDRFVSLKQDKQHPDPIIFGKDVFLYEKVVPMRYFSFDTAEIIGGTKNPKVHKKRNKILVQAIRNLSLMRRIVGTLDAKGLCFVGTVNSIIPRDEEWDMYYLLGLINSTLLNVYFRHRFTTISLTSAFLGELPIKAPCENPKLTKAISQLVQKRLEHETDSDSTEAEIDQLVYKLYGLSNEEIFNVEKTSD